MIYFIRHGESMFNRFGVNIHDVGLTELGKSQAAKIDLSVDLVICSELKRTLQTLRFSNIKYKKLLIIPEIREYRDGLLPNHLQHEQCYTETEESFSKRVQKFNDFLMKIKGEYGSIAVITHHGVLSKLLGVASRNCQIFQYLG